MRVLLGLGLFLGDLALDHARVGLRLGLLLVLGHGRSKPLDRVAEIGADVLEPLGPEDQEHDGENHQKLR